MLQKDYVANHLGGNDHSTREETQRWLGQPDVLCTHEYLHVYQGKPSDTPERRLMAAVLRDAIDCYLRDCFAVNRHRKRSYREAEEWFFNGDDHGVFSLYNVCGILNLDPGYIRRRLVRYKEQNVSSAKSSRLSPQHQQSNIELALAS
jgi:hypothetical protein